MAGRQYRLDRLPKHCHHFGGAYLRSTRSVLKEADEGKFLDGEWARRWGLASAQLHMDAFDAFERREAAPGPRQVAFEASRDPDITPFHQALLGINAHIDFDLPQALLAVIDDEIDDSQLMERRAADHNRVDDILVRRVPEEDKRMREVEQPGDRTVVDRPMMLLNWVGTKRSHRILAGVRVLSSAELGRPA